MTDTTEEPKAHTTKCSTLGDYGELLPIGVHGPRQPELQKGFGFREMDYQTEKEIDEARKRKDGPGNHPAKIVSEVLATMLSEWGGDSTFGKKSRKHKLGMIGAAYSEDILYAWVCLRIQAMGEDLSIDWTCPACQVEMPWPTDLSYMPVTVVDTVPEPVEILLKKPVQFGDKTLVAVNLLPPLWRAATEVKMSRRGSLGDVKSEMLRTAISSFKTKDGEEHPPAPRIFDRLYKRDRERMMKALGGDRFPRCDMTFDIECKSCGHEHSTTLDWTWDFFFGSASLPED